MGRKGEGMEKGKSKGKKNKGKDKGKGKGKGQGKGKGKGKEIDEVDGEWEDDDEVVGEGQFMKEDEVVVEVEGGDEEEVVVDEIDEEEEEEEGEEEEGVEYGRWVVLTTELLFVVISEEGKIYLKAYQPSKKSQRWIPHSRITLHSVPIPPLPSLSHLSLHLVHNTLITVSPYTLTVLTFKVPSSSPPSSSSSLSLPSLPLHTSSSSLPPSPATHSKPVVSKVTSFPSFPSFCPSYLASSPLHFCMFVADFFPPEGGRESEGGEGEPGGEEERAKAEREAMKCVMENFGNNCMTKVLFKCSIFFYLFPSYYLFLTHT